MIWNEEKRFPNFQISLGETLLWSDQPKQDFFLRSSDAYVIPFSLLWCGFAVFWESAALFGNSPFFFKLWGIPFVLVGLCMVIGRFFVDARRRAKTYYGVSSERIIIVSGIFNRDVVAKFENIDEYFA